MRCCTLFVLTALALAVGSPALRGEPKAVPDTRPEIKKMLEELKKQKARLPLPPVTDEEKEKKGKRGFANNGRMRSLYLPADLRGGGGGGDFGRGGGDDAMTLDRDFKTMFFWIASRANNCHY